ncbi:hypothetical protein LMA00_21795 [Burkholderia ambifaria]|uniref:hypothetical protein n=1 Tax=Burkholderia ambifaria TaxID=152480 RepID=UPI001E451B3E|nr:hypothetical protein [Burkholderia ambifaria]UEP52062.1 hypothetical protein LMA00_21795 [Burkholderia ambifaria]
MGYIFDRKTGRGATQSGLSSAADTLDVVLDSEGVPFAPSSCSHEFDYDKAGNLVTDTAFDPVTRIARVQTFTYDGTTLTGHTAWEQQ